MKFIEPAKKKLKKKPITKKPKKPIQGEFTPKNIKLRSRAEYLALKKELNNKTLFPDFNETKLTKAKFKDLKLKTHRSAVRWHTLQRIKSEP